MRSRFSQERPPVSNLSTDLGLASIREDLRAISEWRNSPAEQPTSLALGALASRALNFLNMQHLQIQALRAAIRNCGRGRHYFKDANCVHCGISEATL